LPRILIRYAGAERTYKRKVQARRVRRRPQEGFAWVMLDGESVRCGLLDYTSAGARLVSRYAPLFQPSFTLFLEPDGKEPRSCHIVWQRGTQCGVTFDSRSAVRSKQRPVTSAFLERQTAILPRSSKHGPPVVQQIGHILGPSAPSNQPLHRS